MKILTVSQMRELEARTLSQAKISEKVLIRRAGKAVADWIASRFDCEEWAVLAVCGKGHNGKDALVAAAHLHQVGYKLETLKAWKKDPLKELEKSCHRLARFHRKILLLDGLFGTGLNRQIGAPYRALIQKLTELDATVIAVDLPSGMNADSGKAMGILLPANHTLTLGAPKLGVIQEHAANSVGQLSLLKIGFSPALMARLPSTYELITGEEISQFFRPRLQNSHKGKQGHVLVMGGSVGFAGAPVLAARAALRTGAGLVSMIVPSAVYSAAASLAGPEVMVHPSGKANTTFLGPELILEMRKLLGRADAVVIGPGMGTAVETGAMLDQLLRSYEGTLVLDADGLNLLSKKTAILNRVRAKLILTPHPGEMGRLMQMTTASVEEARFEVAASFSAKYGVTLVLKGTRSIVAHPQRDRRGSGFSPFSINAVAGGPGMATGGAGDALAGILGALLARELSPADAARAGVFLHARAGDLSMPSTGGGTATDLIESLPRAIACMAEACRK